MTAGCRRLIREVPEGTQCKLEGGVHRALRGLLTHNVEQLLQAHKGIMKICPFLFMSKGRWEKTTEEDESLTFTMNISAPS